MGAIIYAIIRCCMLLLSVSIVFAIVISTTRYLVGMFTALPIFIPAAVFIVLLIVIFFIGGYNGKP